MKGKIDITEWEIVKESKQYYLKTKTPLTVAEKDKMLRHFEKKRRNEIEQHHEEEAAAGIL